MPTCWKCALQNMQQFRCHNFNYGWKLVTTAMVAEISFLKAFLPTSSLMCILGFIVLYLALSRRPFQTYQVCMYEGCATYATSNYTPCCKLPDMRQLCYGLTCDRRPRVLNIMLRHIALGKYHSANIFGWLPKAEPNQVNDIFNLYM